MSIQIKHRYTDAVLLPSADHFWNVDRDALKLATAIAARVADKKSSMTMLAHALVRAVNKSHVLIAATDLNVYVWTRVAVTSFGSQPLGHVVPAKELADVVKGMSNATDVMLARCEYSLDVASGTTSTRLRGLPEREFPKVPDDSVIAYHACDAGMLAALIDSVSHAVCKDETRFHLNGVFLEANVGGAMTAVATDGHRLAKARRDGAAPAFGCNGAIVPIKGATEIAKLCSGKGAACEIALKAPYLFVRRGATTLAVKLIDAQFPPYEQVIPKSHTRIAVIPRKALIDALKRAAKLCSETRGVKLAFGDTGFDALTVIANHPDLGEQRERVTCDGVTKDFAIGVNPKYLIDALSKIASSDVAIETGAELDPMLVRGAGSDDRDALVCVVMPMRI